MKASDLPSLHLQHGDGDEILRRRHLLAELRRRSDAARVEPAPKTKPAPGYIVPSPARKVAGSDVWQEF